MYDFTSQAEPKFRKEVSHISDKYTGAVTDDYEALIGNGTTTI